MNENVEPGKIDILPDPPDFSKFRENWTLPDGRKITLRLITSKDKRIEKELIDGLSVKSSRYRFFHVIKDASEEMVNKFCDIDYKNEIAIIAEYDSSDKKQNVGVVRLFIDPGSQTGEFAILVADRFQGSGLGTKFMEILVDLARKRGLKSMYAIVLSENVRMLALLKKMGFSFGENSDGEVNVKLQL